MALPSVFWPRKVFPPKIQIRGPIRTDAKNYNQQVFQRLDLLLYQDKPLICVNIILTLLDSSRFMIKRPVSRGLKLRDVFERAQIKRNSWHLPKSVRWVFIVASVFQFESRKGSIEYIPNWSPPLMISQNGIFKLWHIPNWKYFWKVSYDINSSVYWNCLGTPNALRKWGNIRPSRFLWISPDFISGMTVILNISVSTNHKVGIIWFKPNHCWTHHLFM